MSQDIPALIEYLQTKTEEVPVSVLEHVASVLIKLTDFGAERPRDYFEPFSYIIKEICYQDPDKPLSLPEKSLIDIISLAKK
jgi:hypothetical protein